MGKDSQLSRFIVIICLINAGYSIAVKSFNSDNGDNEVLTQNYEDKITAMKDELDSLRLRVIELERKVRGTRNGQINSLDRKVSGIISNSHVLKKRAIRRRIRRPEVAFMASLTTSSKSVNLYDTIIFNNVITNIHNAYNRHTGIFTAPVSGTYTFNMNIVSEKGHYIEASIKVNDDVTVSAISDHRTPRDGEFFATWDQGNAAAILKLNRGDKVSVSVQWPRGSHVIHGVGKTSFSGYLLRSHEHR